ncbi:NADP-dependent oxidoreductase domain-containing protein [Baffinella frigidus]|nr:NADP-dependent oxidoreductase domain-containing protein [Cryptophyta sp. CCMP2293]
MLRLLFCRLLPLLVVLLAVLVGYIAQSPSPVGTVFWLAAQPMLLSFTATPPVPADMRPLPRPEGEVFRPLLGSGDEMPAAGLGMCCRATAYHEKSVYNTVLWYLLRGGRHIDTAQLYYNHRPIGRAIKEAMQRGVSRDEIFVTTKIEAGYFGTKNTAAWVPQMLEELQLDYVDLVLLHFPRKWLGLFGGVDEFQSCCGCASPRECREQTWHVLSGARENGLIKNVGVSNHLIYQIDELRALDKAPVAVNQLQYHPWVPQWQEDIAQHCRGDPADGVQSARGGHERGVGGGDGDDRGDWQKARRVVAPGDAAVGGSERDDRDPRYGQPRAHTPEHQRLLLHPRRGGHGGDLAAGGGQGVCKEVHVLRGPRVPDSLRGCARFSRAPHTTSHTRQSRDICAY